MLALPPKPPRNGATVRAEPDRTLECEGTGAANRASTREIREGTDCCRAVRAALVRVIGDRLPTDRTEAVRQTDIGGLLDTAQKAGIR